MLASAPPATMASASSNLMMRHASRCRSRPAGDGPPSAGIDHEKLTYKFQGRYYRLTDVHGDVVQGILA